MPGTIGRYRQSRSDLTPGQAKRIYGAAFLLEILNESLPDAQSLEFDTKQVTKTDSTQFFPCFVNKLAQICDIKPGGDNVTAVAVLQPGSVEYRLASNSRTNTAFETVKKFLADDVLGALGQISDQALRNNAQVASLRSGILLKVLAFNRRRIGCYVRLLVPPRIDEQGELRPRNESGIAFCIDSCDRENTPEANSVSQDLGTIQDVAEDVAEMAGEKMPDIVRFTQKSHSLLQVIADCYPRIEAFLRRKTRSDRERTAPTPWTAVRHAIGRLHSYSIAMLVLVEARNRWPELFVGFEVTHVPSAPPGIMPLQMKENRCKGHNILQCLNAERDVFDAYESFNPDLSSNIDRELKARIKASDDRSYTIVHAEVNLADSIYREHTLNADAEGPVRFFNENICGRYIGSSKPTCLLCDLFFDVHPMGFRRRKSHRNLYVKWRMPQGTARNVLERLAERLKDIVFRTITDRAGRVQSRFDSGHTPTDPWRVSTVGTRRFIAARAEGSDFGSVIGQRGDHGAGLASRESFENGEGEDGIEELEALMNRLEVVQAYTYDVGDRRVSCDVLDDEESDDGGAKL